MYVLFNSATMKIHIFPKGARPSPKVLFPCSLPAGGSRGVYWQVAPAAYVPAQDP